LEKSFEQLTVENSRDQVLGRAPSYLEGDEARSCV
jgi:hypothetical protein